MKRIQGKLSAWMSAVAFAEAGEWEMARQMMPEIRSYDDQLTTLNRIYMAVAFAEEGQYEDARRILRAPDLNTDISSLLIKNLGLEGIRMTYGVVSSESLG